MIALLSENVFRKKEDLITINWVWSCIEAVRYPSIHISNTFNSFRTV